ncbi:MAG TPA: phosphoenolpyruvate-utilizing N-terminal domain-containing protein, partial [Planctomycetota bacterium]|nr:phosphoenolpyruvate-utilizing N-terminal domain-containing protein [Planctomycetota bacterium]
MIELKGIAVSPGIGISRAFLLDTPDLQIAQRYIKPTEVSEEIARFERAVDSAKKELEAEQERTRGQYGAEIAQIFKFHLLMLEDRTLTDEIR